MGEVITRRLTSIPRVAASNSRFNVPKSTNRDKKLEDMTASKVLILNSIKWSLPSSIDSIKFPGTDSLVFPTRTSRIYTNEKLPKLK